MTFAAWLVVLLALAVGLPQVFICFAAAFSAGSAMPFVIGLMVLPLVPLILMLEIGRRRRLTPTAAVMAAVLSIAVSSGFYWYLFTHME